MKATQLEEQKLIRAIQDSGGEREMNLLIKSFKFKEIAEATVFKKGGNKFDAEELYADALWEFYKSIRKGKFREESNIKTYFGGICKNLMANKYRTRQRQADNLEKYKMIPKSVSTDLVEELMMKERKNVLLKTINGMPESCRNILLMVAEGINHDEILEKTNLSNKNAIKATIYRCKKSLLNLIQNSEELSEMFSGYHQAKNK